MVIDRYNDNGDALQLYLREIGKTPLLTREEENKLAAQVQRGSKRAREQMIKANLRLVVKISHDYANFGMPLLDLINEGNIGLMKAVERFNPRKGAKLSTYAALWIKQSIRRALSNQSKTIRLPVHIVDKVHKLNRASQKLTERFGREPSDAELAKALEVPAAKVAALRKLGVSPGARQVSRPARSRNPDVALRSGWSTDTHAGASRQKIQGDPRTSPPDPGNCSAQTTASGGSARERESGRPVLISHRYGVVIRSEWGNSVLLFPGRDLVYS